MVSGEANKPFTEEEVPSGSGNKYAVVCPEDEYCVLVNVYRDKKGKFPANFWRVGLYVDGHDVNYWKRVDATSANSDANFITAAFWGFKKSGNDIRQFKVARANPSSAVSDSCSQNSVVGGKIMAIVHAAEIVDGIYDNVGKSISIPAEVNVSDKQKFYTLPSAVTVGGKTARDKEVFLPVSRWRNLSDTPIASLTLQYHTTDMLSIIRELGLSAGSNTGDASKKRPREDDPVAEVVENDDDDVEIVPIVKDIPILDLTEDEAPAQWSTRTVSRL